MKKFIVILLLCFSVLSTAQNKAGFADYAALNRIEFGFSKASVNYFEDMIPAFITIQIENNVYRNISSIDAEYLLRKYFADKDVTNFSFSIINSCSASGQMKYKQNNKTKDIYVDVFYRDSKLSPQITRINITNSIPLF